MVWFEVVSNPAQKPDYYSVNLQDWNKCSYRVDKCHISKEVGGWGQKNDNFLLIYSKVNSVQEACDKCFVVHILKFEILQIIWKKWNKEHQTLGFHFLPINVAFWCFLFCFFIWFARFQILICKLQSIWRKLLVLSWLQICSIFI